jgi:acetyl esterase/lipase
MLYVRFRSSLVLTLMAAFWSAACTNANAQTVTPGIAYVKTAHGAETGDLYEPAGSGPFPAIVYIHGGSWRSGSKSNFRELAMDLAAKGYVGFAIDYDLQAHSFPVSWQESAAAVRFLRDHAAAYHVDPRRILVAGASAGGQLAALVALAPGGPASPSPEVPTADTSDSVAGAIILNGVFDLTGKYHVIERYLGGSCSRIKAICLEASPMQHIHAGAPPFFVGHGSADRVVPYASAALFSRDMKAAGNAVTFYTQPGGPHMYFAKKRYYAANLAALESFLAGVAPVCPSAQ